MLDLLNDLALLRSHYRTYGEHKGLAVLNLACEQGEGMAEKGEKFSLIT